MLYVYLLGIKNRIMKIEKALEEKLKKKTIPDRRSP
jgi:hypothetical protein